MASAQMGSVILGGILFLLPNSNRHSSPVAAVSSFEKPSLKALKKFTPGRRSWDLRGRSGGFRAAAADLADGELGRPPSISGVLEKNFNFSPMFDDYVKVMESVKTERSLDLGLERTPRSTLRSFKLKRVDSSKSRDRFDSDLKRKSSRVGRGRSEGSSFSQNLAKDSEFGTHESSSCVWGMVEGIMEEIREEKSVKSYCKCVRERKLDLKESNSKKSGIFTSSALERNEKLSEEIRQISTHGKVKNIHLQERESSTRRDNINEAVDVREQVEERNLVSKESNSGKLSFTCSMPDRNVRYSEEIKQISTHGKVYKYEKKRNLQERESSTRRDIMTGAVDCYKHIKERNMVSKESNSEKSRDFTSTMPKRNVRYSAEIRQISSHGKVHKYEQSRNLQERESSKQRDIINEAEDDQKHIQERNLGSKESNPEKSGGFTCTMPKRNVRYSAEIRQISTHGKVHKYEWSRNFQERKSATKRDSLNELENLEASGEFENTSVFESKLHNGSRMDQRASDMKLKRSKNTYNHTKDVVDEDRYQFPVLSYDGKKNEGSITHKLKLQDGSSKADEFEERAAFKTFEVFTDVKNMPRVLRMEMEVRIDKLAKRLHASNLNMPEWQFSKIMHSANIKFTEHTILGVIKILGALGNWKRVLHVVEWLQSHERFKSYKSRYIYTTVLSVLGKANRPMESLNIFYMMRQGLSSYPDLAAYHCIAVTLGQAGLMKELFDVIDCMRALPPKKFDLGPLQEWDPRVEPDLVVYNSVLNACVQRKQWEGVFWVLQQLKLKNIKITNTTYGLAMEVMLVCGKYNLVHEFFRKLNKSSIPSALNYKVLVNTLWMEGKIDEAVKAVQDMERRGIVGSASLYYDLARCLCKAGRCEEALLQVEKICRVAKKPLVVTYTGLIQACLDSGRIDDGTYIFDQMCKFCSPNIITCNIMLNSYLKHGRMEKAITLYENILSGDSSSSKAYSSKDLTPDKFMFNKMLGALAAEKNWSYFEYVYQQMLIHGFFFDKRSHLRMVLDAYRAGQVWVLELTWDRLLRSGRVPPPPLIKERVCKKLKENEVMAAIACLASSSEADILSAFSKNAWLNLLTRDRDRLNNDTVSRLANELDSHVVSDSDGNYPQRQVYANLRDACRVYLSRWAAYLESSSVG